METKVCRYCGEELPIEEFSRNAFGFTSVCKKCNTEKRKLGREKVRRLKQQVVDAQNARTLRINDFTPRELMQELKRRGYEFKITFTETHTIDSKDI